MADIITDPDKLDHGLWAVVVWRPGLPPARTYGPFASELEAGEWAARKIAKTGMDLKVIPLLSPKGIY